MPGEGRSARLRGGLFRIGGGGRRLGPCLVNVSEAPIVSWAQADSATSHFRARHRWRGNGQCLGGAETRKATLALEAP